MTKRSVAFALVDEKFDLNVLIIKSSALFPPFGKITATLRQFIGRFASKNVYYFIRPN